MTAMKKLYDVFAGSALFLAVAALCSSCSMDEPFGEGADAFLSLNTEINGDVVKTRSIDSEEYALLREKCVVYIENDKGAVRRYKGLDNIPEVIKLKTGSYVAEAWSGDSVSASFSSKFYRGWQKFDMAEGQNSLTLKCNIANVVVSVDPASLDVDLADLKVTFSHSRGSLEFTEENIASAKGYFMMPNADKDLDYRIEGTSSSGSSYVREGKIENVERAHEYCMTISQDPSEITEGGALIRLVIEDIPLIEETVDIFPAPSVSGVGFNIEDQVVSVERDFQDTKVHVRGYFGISSLLVNFSDNFTGLSSNVNVLDNTVAESFLAKGIRVEKTSAPDATDPSVNVDEVYITFSKAFLDALEASPSEYVVSFEATDSKHRVGKGSLRIANDNDAVEHPAPVGTAPAPDPETQPMAVGARRATLQGYLYDETAASNFGIKYRKQGDSEWIVAMPTSSAAAAARRGARRASGTRSDASTFSVTITGLEPGTTYEYKSFCDGFDKAPVNTFSTESIFVIPNASFEEWGTYSAKTLLGTRTVILPSASGDKEVSFWGSGNEGSATANMTLTDKSTDMVHSGTYSARMESKSAMGVIAAGNLFVGTYVKTDGTNGVLSLGRPYNGSHPSKIRVWANYRPGSDVTISNGNEDLVEVTQGGTDEGQIYVALTNGSVDIRTKPAERKLFDKDDNQVIAYGQVTWKEAFGPDGQLQLLEIPLVYNERANSTRPTHLVITCAASKWGDYFSGSVGSTIYVDDFELIYE